MTTFHDIRFPEDISYGSSGGPEFSTSIITVSSGHEQRNSQWNQARARYNVAYGVRSEAQLAALIAFFRARAGRAYAFRFRDWADYQSAPVMTPQDMELGTGNGSNRAFALVKRYVSGGHQYQRFITRPVANTVLVSLQGAEVTTGWTLSSSTGIITFDAAPASGVTVRAGFAFDVPARFDTDYLATSLDSYGIGSALDVPIIEVRE
jgi:uncharacterized protein (TIGR02217 family)